MERRKRIALILPEIIDPSDYELIKVTPHRAGGADVPPSRQAGLSYHQCLQAG